MPTITVPDAVYDRLARRAAALGTTPDALALPAIERAAGEPPAVDRPIPSASDLSPAERLRLMAEHMRAIEARDYDYPPGHVTDVSRESIYEGCGE